VSQIRDTPRALPQHTRLATGFTGDFQPLWHFDGKTRQADVGGSVSFFTHSGARSDVSFFLGPTLNALLRERRRKGPEIARASSN